MPNTILVALLLLMGCISERTSSPKTKVKPKPLPKIKILGQYTYHYKINTISRVEFKDGTNCVIYTGSRTHIQCVRR